MLLTDFIGHDLATSLMMKSICVFFSSFIPVHLVSAEIGNGNNKTLLENLVSVDTHRCQKPRGSGNITSKLVPTRLPD